MLFLFTIMHPIVDACSVSVLSVGGMTWERVFMYNFFAFAMQFPFGILMDESQSLNRCGFFLGSFLTLASVLAAILGFAGWFILASACIGNALFHLTAGKYLLEKNNGHSGVIGLFIATGALGLMVGQLWVFKAAQICLSVNALILALCIMSVACKEWKVSGQKMEDLCVLARQQFGVQRKCNVWKIFIVKLILLGLFVLIAWRGWLGLFVSGRSAGGCALLMIIGAIVTFSGKIVGGYIAEYVGRWKVVIASVAGSVILAYFCNPSWVVAWFVLVFVAQLATGPVLSLVYDMTDRRGGRAFGLNCLGLFAGSFS